MKHNFSPVWVGIFFIAILAILDLGPARRVFEGSVMPVVFWFEKPISNVLFRSRERSANDDLLNANRDLEEQLSALQKQNEGNKNPSLSGAIASQVLGFSPEKGYGLIYVNKGSRDAIKVGDLVLLPNNTLVGKVAEVHGDFSIVQSLFSESIKISVEIGNDHVPGLFSNANGSDLADLSLVPRDASPTIDSLIETSGQDGLFPRGILVGSLKTINEVPAAASLEGKIQIPYEPMGLNQMFIVSNPFST